MRNGLKPSEVLGSMDFSVDMETGTGKTYVYLRTIYELNKQYGFTKFIIVVPSIAIKEGVHKALQITQEHLRGLYDNTNADFFVYDSQKLGQVRSFATADCIQIMVINIDAFRKSFTDPAKETKANIIHRANDKLSGIKPIEFICDTNPIVIIDEPQSVDTTPKSKAAIDSLNPLCTLRYSATHRDKYNLLYKLDSVDAYQRKLVKQIEVASVAVRDGHNRPYVKLLSVDNRRSPISASIELDAMQGGHVQRITRKVRGGDDLLELSGGRSIYDGYIINEIYCEDSNEYIDFTSKPEFIRLGEAVGGVDEDAIKRLQIQKTIEEHLDKELRLRPQGLKVLSLFFIDRVANYRSYDDEGNPQPGKYAIMFEGEYLKLIRKPKYHTLFEEVDIESTVAQVHNGYFAIDRKKDTKGENLFKESRGEGKAQADEGAYELIMRDKERLLSFDSRLKFIFSHSALREGWDNPNVFQICTLNESTSVMKKRQEIGRGLRIAVNQDGERVPGFEVNTLTVMANESYEDFCAQLQKEIEEDEGIRFGVVEKHLFANIPIETGDHHTTYLGVEASEQIWQHLFENFYIDGRGKVQDPLKNGLRENKVSLPENVSEHAAPIIDLLTKVAGDLNVKNANDRKKVDLNKRVFLSPEFKELWDRIKHRTTFRVDFDTERLIEKCAEDIKLHLVVGKARFRYEKAVADVTRGGVLASEVREQETIYNVRDFGLPDIVSFLQNETQLTRRTLVRILIESGRLDDFKSNPQKFIDEVSAFIKHQMQLFIVDGIKYQKIGDDNYYAQELFEECELHGHLSKNMAEAKKSVYNHVIYDSEVEAGFVNAFERNEAVKVYAKLPPWFKINTPLGSYNPDWAVLIDQEEHERLYFVVESKGTMFLEALRPAEKAKIDCGHKHFEALGTDVTFTMANSYEKLSGRF